MREVKISPEANAVLDDLWHRGLDELVELLEDAIDWIGEGDSRSRAHRLEGPDFPDGAWVIAVRHAGDTWIVVWDHLADVPAVRGIARTEVF
ncbi:MAG: hypothetical protein LBG11_10280 [Bifidobacteriaceae bacterium]|jgi:hypothetical protein|nr:hypothetical protein [Bifidobacteriaceae bacterium]